MALNCAPNHFGFPLHRQTKRLIPWHKAQVPVPAVRTGLITLEILGLKSPPALSLRTGPKPVRPKPSPRKEVIILNGDDVIRARQAAREMAQDLGFGIVDQISISTATCELSRNVYQYSGKGKVTMQPVSRQGARGLKIVVEDQGPGIPKYEPALPDGLRADRGCGDGLTGSRGLMDEFDLQSQIGVGTTVRLLKWLK
jgi:serine/threonine-protein kinase RsbT